MLSTNLLPSFFLLSTMSLLSPSSITAAPLTEHLTKRASYLLPWLFPYSPNSVPTGSSGFTTSTSLSPHSDMKSALGVIGNKGFGSYPSEGTAPDGHHAIVAYYPQGSINPGNKAAPHGGFSWYTSGPSSFDFTSAKEITLSYSIYFQSGFEWALGGKIPGLFGGDGVSDAVDCSGGRQDGRDECFSVRMMWRTNGAGEIYSYLPTSVTQPSEYYNYPPQSVSNPAYGDSIGRGAFDFVAGSWNTVSLRVRLNDVGGKNGEFEVWLNGQQKINLSGLTIRVKDSTLFRGIFSQTFFGGSSSPYASPQDQYAWFKDWSVQKTASW